MTDVGAYYPHRVTLPPLLPFAALAAHGRRAAARCCERCAGSTSSNCRSSDQCCGFGGTFAVKNADVSTAMLADKMRCVLETGAEVCTAADNSCLMQIGGGLSRATGARRPLRPHRRDPRVGSGRVA